VHIVGRLLLASDHLNGSVFAVDRGTAREVWRRVGSHDKFGALTSPVVVNGRAIYASIDNYVYAVDPATGAVRWQTQNEGSNLSVAVCGTRVFANYMDLAILDSDSGVVRGKVRTGEIFSDFAVADGRVFAVSDHGIYAYSCR
jgi:outer membrane protein assembly factor BamB